LETDDNGEDGYQKVFQNCVDEEEMEKTSRREDGEELVSQHVLAAAWMFHKSLLSFPLSLLLSLLSLFSPTDSQPNISLSSPIVLWLTALSPLCSFA